MELKKHATLMGVVIPALFGFQTVATAQVANVNVEQEYAAQVELMGAMPNGPADKPWEQWFGDKMADTAKYAKPGSHRVCFSNAGVGNAWRVTGWTTMQAEADLHRDEIKSFDYADAQGNDDKQISDIRSFLNSGSCDVLIVSPNTSAALTPVVEEACKVLPVITFDRSVNTSCPVTAIRSIGGYAWGKASADYVVQHVPKGGKVLVLRTAPGLDIFETRWTAAERVFKEAGIQVIGNEFVGADRAKTKATVSDYISRTGQIDAVWVDLGVVSVAVAEAFQDMGLPYPVITGEDEQDYLRAWKQDGFQGIAPTYPAYQWRTALLAALKVMKGEPVPGPEWILPQPVITEADRDTYIDPKLPPLHFATCGCADMPGYPERWGANN